MVIWLITMGVIVSGLLAIWYGYRQPQGGYYLFKPLTMILIILMASLGGEGFSKYKALILAGLFFSLLGDVFLMLPDDRFLAGLAAFLIAHLSYIAGFLFDQGSPVYWPILPVFGLCALIAWILKDGLGRLKIPVFTYMSVIGTMAWLAWSRWIIGGGMDHLVAFIGAGLFLSSDLILALNRFKVELKAARALDLSTYYAGQWLIALSAVGLEWLGK